MAKANSNQAVQPPEASGFEDSYYVNDQTVEANSLHLNEDWDTQLVDFFDDFDDTANVDFPPPDDFY